MIIKEDELMILGLLNEDKIEGKIALTELHTVFHDLLQVGPMFRTFCEQLLKNNLIDEEVSEKNIDRFDVAYSDVFVILRSSYFLRDVPHVSIIDDLQNDNRFNWLFYWILVYELSWNMG